MVSTAIRQGNKTNVVENTQLNPAYRYLRVQSDGQPPALLVLGYTDPHPLGDVEIWYSAQREVIRIRQGRLIGTAGLQTDWSAVHYPQAPPRWQDIGEIPVKYQRRLDQRPGYKDNIEDTLVVALAGKNPSGASVPIPIGLQNRQLQWYTETLVEPSASQLPPAWFARGQHGGLDTIVFSRQCLSEGFCITLQVWPTEGRAP